MDLRKIDSSMRKLFPNARINSGKLPMADGAGGIMKTNYIAAHWVKRKYMGDVDAGIDYCEDRIINSVSFTTNSMNKECNYDKRSKVELCQYPYTPQLARTYTELKRYFSIYYKMKPEVEPSNTNIKEETSKWYRKGFVLYLSIDSGEDGAWAVKLTAIRNPIERCE